MLSAFVHPNLRNPNHPNFKKALWSSWLMVVLTAFVFLYSIFFYFYHPEDTVKQVTNFIGVVYLIVVLLQLRYVKNLNVVLMQLAICGVLPTMVSIYHTGGIYSVDLVWLFLNIVCAFLVAGVSSGLVVAFLSLVYVSFLYYKDFFTTKTHFKEFVISHDSTHHIITLGFVIIIMAAILIVFVRSLENANRTLEAFKEAQISELEKQLQKKSEELVNLRSDLAKDFHDEMGNKLASINILSQSISLKLKNHEIEESNQMLQTIEKRSNDLYYGTKDFIWSIGLKSDYLIELFIYLREFGEVFFNELEIDFKSHFNSDEKVIFTPTVTRNLVYVIKEIFTNSAKHAKCSQVNFGVEVLQGELLFCLSDNGQGFDVSILSNRGLANIQKRVHSVGGTYELNSDRNKGTSIKLRIPFTIVATHLG